MKKRTVLIPALCASLVIAGTLVGVSLYLNDQSKTEITLKLIETNTPRTVEDKKVNGGQAILVKGKSNILIDVGSPYYSETLTLKNVVEDFDGIIDTLVLTSMSYEYNGGLEAFFSSSRYPTPLIRNLYYPGYSIDNDYYKYFEETLLPSLKDKGVNVCTASDVVNGKESCQNVIDLSQNYQLQILNTRQYTTSSITDDDIQKYNMILSISDKKDSFHFMIDGGLDATTLKRFNTYYALTDKVKAWVLSNPNISSYINSEYYFGFRPETTVFTASSYSTQPSIYDRMTMEEFRTILQFSKKKIYTPLTMGTMQIFFKTNKKLDFKGSLITHYNAFNNTENQPFIYSDMVRRNAQLCNAVKDVLGIDVTYKN